MLVAEVDGVYAGFLYWFRGTRRRDDFGNFNYAQILNVSTVEGFNRGKVLLNLIGRASKDIEDAGIGIVYVQTDERSKALIRMYEDVGYTTYARTLHLRLTNRETREPRERTHQENMELAVFMVELKEQCRALLIAYEELNEIIDLGPPSELEAKLSN